MTKSRDKKAALKFLKKQCVSLGGRKSSSQIGCARIEIGAANRWVCVRWLNNRAENSHVPFQRRESAKLRFRQMRYLQKFAAAHSSVYNHFKQKRSAKQPRYLQAYMHRRSRRVEPALFWVSLRILRQTEASSNSPDSTRRPASKALLCHPELLGIAFPSRTGLRCALFLA